eukprot:6345832-Heterocapsa_arctica.AAC.1
MRRPRYSSSEACSLVGPGGRLLRTHRLGHLSSATSRASSSSSPVLETAGSRTLPSYPGAVGPRPKNRGRGQPDAAQNRE